MTQRMDERVRRAKRLVNEAREALALAEARLRRMRDARRRRHTPP
jgi:hypothetical protein